MEILIGIVLAIVWHWHDHRHDHYIEEDWQKIKDDWLKGED